MKIWPAVKAAVLASVVADLCGSASMVVISFYTAISGGHFGIEDIPVPFMIGFGGGGALLPLFVFVGVSIGVPFHLAALKWRFGRAIYGMAGVAAAFLSILVVFPYIFHSHFSYDAALMELFIAVCSGVPGGLSFWRLTRPMRDAGGVQV